jgi:hypothetical protein
MALEVITLPLDLEQRAMFGQVWAHMDPQDDILVKEHAQIQGIWPSLTNIK